MFLNYKNTKDPKYVLKYDILLIFKYCLENLNCRKSLTRIFNPIIYDVEKTHFSKIIN